MEIFDIKKLNYSWDIDNDLRNKQNYDNTSEKGYMTLTTNIVHKFSKADEDNNLLKTVVDFKMELKKEEPFAKYLVQYEITTRVSDSFKNKVKNEEEEVDQAILYIIEPYFRFDVSRTLFDADLPATMVPYQFWKMH